MDERPEVDPRQMRRAAETVVRRLREAGHTAYFAGGCVRDALMGRDPSDYDVATDAHPDVTQSLFRVAHYVGESFGVVRVREAGAWIEVATFRTEGDYVDGRRPQSVQFTSAERDAERRDFTINGLFYDPIGDRVIDFVGGRADLEAGVVRAIGDPEKRFGEDYLRMLRAVRFAARLRFELEPDTARAIRQHAADLGRISRERIGGEVAAMLLHATRAVAVRLMNELGLDGPALGEPPAGAGGTTRILERLSGDVREPVALAVWAMDRHLRLEAPADPEALRGAIERMKSVAIVRQWRGALVLSNGHRDAMKALLDRVGDMPVWPTLSIAVRKRLLARADWPDLHRLARACVEAFDVRAFDAEAFEADIAALREQGVAPEPLLSGDALIAAGHEPGPRFKHVLDDVYDAQLEARVTDAAQALELARSLLS